MALPKRIADIAPRDRERVRAQWRRRSRRYRRRRRLLSKEQASALVTRIGRRVTETITPAASTKTSKTCSTQ